MTPQQESKKILSAIQLSMRQKGYRYSDLAEYLGVSLPTVKRMFSIGELSLNRLCKVAEFLELSLLEITENIRNRDHAVHELNEEQEEFFAANPEYLAYLFTFLRERNVDKIEKENGLSKSSSKKYIEKLCQLGLLHRTPKGVILAKIRGSVTWSDHGILGNTFSRSMIRNFTKASLKKLSNPGEMYVGLSGWKLTSQQYRDLQNDLEQIAKDYRLISNQNRFSDQATRYVSMMAIADFWDDPTFYKIKELSSSLS